MRNGFALVVSLALCASNARAANTISPSQFPKKCLDVSNGATTNGTSVRLWDCVAGNANQQWNVTNGSLQGPNGKCVDVSDGTTTNGTHLQIWDCASGNTNQAWTYANGSLTWTGKNKCVDLTDGASTNGTLPQIWDCTSGNTNQQWTLGSDSTTNPNATTQPTAYITTPALTTPFAALSPKTGTVSGANATITVNASQTYQSFVGVGAALSDSSSYLIYNKLSSSARSTLLSTLFDPKAGIGLSFLRLQIGASDFSTMGDYSCDDNPAGGWDANLTGFQINQDLKASIPVLQSIVQINPNITLFATPWSAPAWMKTNASMDGTPAGRGSPWLQSAAYAPYAQYFVKFLQAYAAKGINISAVTPQNEPLFEDSAYPGMGFSAAAETTFIGKNLGPALAAAKLSTRVWGYDHNWDTESYPETIVNDAAAGPYTDAAAFHCYGGDVSAMTTFHNNHPQKSVYLTECSGGTWQGDPFGDTADLIINSSQNYARGVALWNLALDPNNGPTNHGCLTCRGVVTINPTSGNITYNADYYALAHISRFVRPGATRIGVSWNGAVNATAFKNADGTTVVFAHNTAQNSQVWQIAAGTKSFNFTVPARSLITLVY